jgi:stress response protein YsnF
VVRVRKLVREHVEEIDEPLRHDEVDIEHIAVNRVVDAPAG